MLDTPDVVILRRTLSIDALLSAASGAALVVFPRFLLVTVLGQPPYPDYALIRVAGVSLFVVAMLMVLVGHRIEELWWWSWAFAILSAGIALVATVRAGFGSPGDAAAWPWWMIAAVDWALTGAFLWGLARAGTERPPI